MKMQEGNGSNIEKVFQKAICLNVSYFYELKISSKLLVIKTIIRAYKDNILK